MKDVNICDGSLPADVNTSEISFVDMCEDMTVDIIIENKKIVLSLEAKAFP